MLLCHRKCRDFQYGWELKYLTEETKCSLLAKSQRQQINSSEVGIWIRSVQDCTSWNAPHFWELVQVQEGSISLRLGIQNLDSLLGRGFFMSGLLIGNYLGKYLGNLGQTLNYWEKQCYYMYFFWLEWLPQQQTLHHGNLKLYLNMEAAFLVVPVWNAIYRFFRFRQKYVTQIEFPAVFQGDMGKNKSWNSMSLLS